MSDRRQRMPVFGMDMGKSPRDIREVDAAGDPSILIDVTRIVVVNEIEAQSLCKHDACDYRETRADSDDVPRDVDLPLAISTIAIAKIRMAKS